MQEFLASGRISFSHLVESERARNRDGGRERTDEWNAKGEGGRGGV